MKFPVSLALFLVCFGLHYFIPKEPWKVSVVLLWFLSLSQCLYTLLLHFNSLRSSLLFQMGPMLKYPVFLLSKIVCSWALDNVVLRINQPCSYLSPSQQLLFHMNLPRKSLKKKKTKLVLGKSRVLTAVYLPKHSLDLKLSDCMIPVVQTTFCDIIHHNYPCLWEGRALLYPCSVLRFLGHTWVSYCFPSRCLDGRYSLWGSASALRRFLLTVLKKPYLLPPLGQGVCDWASMQPPHVSFFAPACPS